MDLEEYSAQQQALTAALVAFVLRMLDPFRVPALTEQDWLSILRTLFPQVEFYRRQSAQLGRRFYDSERARRTGSYERHNTLLPEFKFAWFVEVMEPARAAILEPGAPEHAVSQAALRAAKAVEDGGRRAILQAVDTDPVRPRWARIATGRETCGFCMMLVSRGPVYHDAESAGLDLDDTSALDAWERRDYAAMQEAMVKWHTGCDCKAVPVFDRSNWPGLEAQKRAEKAWREITKGARDNQDAMNRFRRAVESGRTDVREFAAVAA